MQFVSELRRQTIILAMAAAALLSNPLMANAQIKIGVTVSATGGAASLGIPYRNSLSLVPQEIAGQKVELIILDDASDPTNAVRNARQLVSEHKVDIILGANTSPIALALVDVASESKTPFIAMASSIRIVAPMDDKRFWVFKSSQADKLMVTGIVQDMVARKVKRVAFLGLNDAFGESFWAEFEPVAKAAGLEIVASERYARNDTSVTGQVLKMVSANPDAVFIASLGTPAALPAIALAERNFKKPQYQTHAVLNQDFLRVGGKNIEGTILPAGPMLVAEQLPANNPVRPTALAYVKAYEDKFGPGTRAGFGGHAYDAFLLFANAVPKALKSAAPGTPQFRQALRDAIEQTSNMAGVRGIFSLSPQDHIGLDDRARHMIQVQNGKWTLIGATTN